MSVVVDTQYTRYDLHLWRCNIDTYSDLEILPRYPGTEVTVAGNTPLSAVVPVA